MNDKRLQSGASLQPATRRLLLRSQGALEADYAEMDSLFLLGEPRPWENVRMGVEIIGRAVYSCPLLCPKVPIL